MCYRSCVLYQLLFITCMFFMQKSIEKIRSKRKRQKSRKQKSHQQKKAVHVVDKLGNKQPILLKTDKKLMAEVDDMLMAKLREKAVKWKYDYNHANSCNDDATDDELKPDVQKDINPILHEEECKKVNDTYAMLMESCNNKLEVENDSSPSLLLPAFIPPLEKVEVNVKETNNVIEKMSAKQYIETLREERHAAIRSARLYRSQVDELRRKNRKLYCEMHDKIDTIRNFWRNNIAEGSSRAGMCVKLAMQKR